MLGEKYSSETIDKIIIKKSTEDHMRGMVNFLPTKEDLEVGRGGEGGMFLAAKIDGEWRLIYDGNGVIKCSLVNKYNFPSDMITDCADL